MHFDNLPALLSSLAGSAVGIFVFAVVLDNVMGVVGALKAKTFDIHKLPSFLVSQFGTRQVVALGGLVLAATVTGGDIKQAVLAAVTAGGGALTLSVLADAYGKMKALVS